MAKLPKTAPATKAIPTTATDGATSGIASTAETTGAEGGASVDGDGSDEPVSEVATATGETVVLPDSVLNTETDPKTANGDEVRKETGISASATAEQVLADGGVDTIEHSTALAPADVPAVPVASAKPSAPVETTVARVLAAVTLGATRFDPNDVVEGLPRSMAVANRDSVDTHPDAVNYARTQGFPVKQYSEV